MLTRVSRAAWRLEQAERERVWARASARAEGISIRTLAKEAACRRLGCTSSWPPPTWMRWTRRSASCGQRAGQPPKIQTPGRTPNWTAGTISPTGYPMRWAGCESARTGRRTWTLIATRQWSTCARPPTGRKRRLHRRRPCAGAGGHRPHRRRCGRTRPRPAGRGPDHRRSAARPAGRTPPVRLAEPDLEFRAFCTREGLPASSTPQLERAWDAYQAERNLRGETSQRAAYTDNPFRPRWTTTLPQRTPGQFRKRTLKRC